MIRFALIENAAEYRLARDVTDTYRANLERKGWEILKAWDFKPSDSDVDETVNTHHLTTYVRS